MKTNQILGDSACKSPVNLVDKTTMSPDQLEDIRRCKRLIEFFNAIPEEKWSRQQLRWSDGRACALGHLGVTAFRGPRLVPDALWMEQKFHECLAGTPVEKLIGGTSVEAVNDYPGNPKRQILLTLSEILNRLTAPSKTGHASDVGQTPAGGLSHET